MAIYTVVFEETQLVLWEGDIESTAWYQLRQAAKDNKGFPVALYKDDKRIALRHKRL
jgi:hypothetical protein